MLYIDGIGLSFLIKEVREKILNYKLTKIYQYDRSSLSFFLGKNNLLFQVKDNSTIFYLKDEKDFNTDFQSRFLLSLKKYLLNSILINIRQEGFDRIVYFDFEKLNQFGDIEKYTLIMEIMGKASNIFLTSCGKILSALYFSGIDQGNRVIMTGTVYTLPFEKKKISPLYLDENNFPFSSPQNFMDTVEGIGKAFGIQCYKDYKIFKNYIEDYSPVFYEIENKEKQQKILTYNNFSEFSEKSFSSEEFDRLNDGLNFYFKSTITSNVINEKKKNLLKYTDSQIKKFEKILRNIDIDLKKNQNYENYKKIGDILAANMHLVKYKMENITLFDFYDNSNIDIQLDPLLSPKDNLKLYYNRYNKGKRTVTILESRAKDIKEDIRYFEEVKVFIQKENDFIGIEEIENELKISNKSKIKLNRNKKRELLSFEYDGFKIFVGRNNKENEEITFSKGNTGDVWLHVKDIPGSHVLIIRGNREVNQNVLYYAARLAGEYSKANTGDKVIVDYCEKKFVKKIRNAKPGNVTYSNFNSINITI